MIWHGIMMNFADVIAQCLCMMIACIRNVQNVENGYFIKTKRKHA